jgi:hypothetical protein
MLSLVFDLLSAVRPLRDLGQLSRGTSTAIHPLTTMDHIPFLLVALSAVGKTTAYLYAYNKEAKISLFELAKFSETSFSINDLDCRAGQQSTDITLAVNTCLWGHYFLVDNFQITSYPACANGAKTVTYFYEATSCTATQLSVLIRLMLTSKVYVFLGHLQRSCP